MNQQIEPTYLRYIYDGLTKGDVHPDNASTLPDGLIGLYEEAFDEYIPVTERQKLLKYFAIWALLKKEVSAKFVAEVIREKEETVIDFIANYSKWFNTPESGKFQLYHERLRVFLLQKLPENEVKAIQKQLIARLEKAIEEKKADDFEYYALQYLSHHLMVEAFANADGKSLLAFTKSEINWDRQILFSNKFDWSKQGLQNAAAWTSKHDQEENIFCYLKLVELHVLEQNSVKTIFNLVSENQLPLAFERILTFRINYEDKFKCRFLLYVYCIYDLLLNENVTKDYKRTIINSILEQVKENVPIDYTALSWDNFLPASFMFNLALQLDELGCEYNVLFQRTKELYGLINKQKYYSDAELELLLKIISNNTNYSNKWDLEAEYSVLLCEKGQFEKAIEIARSIYSERIRCQAFIDLSSEIFAENNSRLAIDILIEAYNIIEESEYDKIVKAEFIFDISNKLYEFGEKEFSEILFNKTIEPKESYDYCDDKRYINIIKHYCLKNEYDNEFIKELVKETEYDEEGCWTSTIKDPEALEILALSYFNSELINECSAILINLHPMYSINVRIKIAKLLIKKGFKEDVKEILIDAYDLTCRELKNNDFFYYKSYFEILNLLSANYDYELDKGFVDEIYDLMAKSPGNSYLLEFAKGLNDFGIKDAAIKFINAEFNSILLIKHKKDRDSSFRSLFSKISDDLLPFNNKDIISLYLDFPTEELDEATKKSVLEELIETFYNEKEYAKSIELLKFIPFEEQFIIFKKPFIATALNNVPFSIINNYINYITNDYSKLNAIHSILIRLNREIKQTEICNLISLAIDLFENIYNKENEKTNEALTSETLELLNHDPIDYYNNYKNIKKYITLLIPELVNHNHVSDFIKIVNKHLSNEDVPFTLLGLVNAMYKLGNTDAAQTLLDSLINDKYNNLTGYLKCSFLINVAKLYQELKKFDLAHYYTIGALDAIDIVENKTGKDEVLKQILEQLIIQGDLPTALEVKSKIEDIYFDDEGNQFLLKLSNQLFNLGHKELALSYVLEAREFVLTIKDKEKKNKLLRQIIQTLISQGYNNHLIETANSITDLRSKGDILLDIGQYFISINLFKEAINIIPIIKDKHNDQQLFYKLANTVEDLELMDYLTKVAENNGIEMDYIYSVFLGLYIEKRKFIEAKVYIDKIKDNGQKCYELTLLSDAIFEYNDKESEIYLNEAIMLYQYEKTNLDEFSFDFFQGVQGIFWSLEKRNKSKEAISFILEYENLIYKTLENYKIWDQSFVLQGISNMLFKLNDFHNAFRIINKMRFVSSQNDAWTELGALFFQKNLIEDAFKINQMLPSNEAKKYFYKNIYNNDHAKIISTTSDKVKIQQHLLNQNIEGIEIILTNYALNCIFFQDNYPIEKLDKFNEVLNIQWAIDIKKNYKINNNYFRQANSK